MLNRAFPVSASNARQVAGPNDIIPAPEIKIGG
jgi:hypothetical protein